MRNLFNSRVRVEELKTVRGPDGRMVTEYFPVTGSTDLMTAKLQSLPCRLDLVFLRPGKDVPQAVNAGKAPDRIGVMFCERGIPLKAGHRVTAVPNKFGEIPVPGSFEIKTIPDVAVGYSRAHHIEVQIVETVNDDIDEVWPTNAD